MPRVVALFLLLSQKGSSPFASFFFFFLGSPTPIHLENRRSHEPIRAQFILFAIPGRNSSDNSTCISFSLRLSVWISRGTMQGIKGDPIGVGIPDETQIQFGLTLARMHTNTNRHFSRYREQAMETRILRILFGVRSGVLTNAS